jgi:hypothetical protein
MLLLLLVQSIYAAVTCPSGDVIGLNSCLNGAGNDHLFLK